MATINVGIHMCLRNLNNMNREVEQNLIRVHDGGDRVIIVNVLIDRGGVLGINVGKIIEDSVITNFLILNPRRGHSRSHGNGAAQHLGVAGVCFVVDPLFVNTRDAVEHAHLLAAIAALTEVPFDLNLKRFCEALLVEFKFFSTAYGG